MFACLHDSVLGRRTSDCLIVLSLHPNPIYTPPRLPPSFGQLETEFIRFVLLLFSLPTAPFPPPFPSPPHCRNRICRNHSKARYNLLLAVHNTPSHSHPLSQSHKVPCGWTNHTWNIISASYSSILWTAPFYGAMDLTPAWSLSHQSVQAGRGWERGEGGKGEMENLFVFMSLCLHFCLRFPKTWLPHLPGGGNNMEHACNKKQKNKKNNSTRLFFFIYSLAPSTKFMFRQVILLYLWYILHRQCSHAYQL